MKAVILDMYGVILNDTGDGFVPYVNKTFPNLKPEEIYDPWFKADVGELSSLDVFKHLGFEGDLAKIQQEYLDTIDVNEGFYEFAESIRKHFGLALISNDCSEWSLYFREKYNLNKYFDAISISGDLKFKKPDERIFKHSLQKLGCLATECVYIDDREFNLEAAHVLGMDTILFNSRNVVYQGKTVNSFKELGMILLNDSWK